MSEHRWGLAPLPGEAKDNVSWGARAIYRDCTIDIVWDRCSWSGIGSDADPPAALVKWIDEVGLPKLRKAVIKGRLGQAESRDVVIEDKDFCLKANPRRSHGYLYIGAWRKP